MCNLELAVNFLCISEIILEMYSTEYCFPTVILKQALKVSVGMVFTGEYYGFLKFCVSCPMGILPSSKYEIL